MQLSSAYRPQTDGQTEVINRCLENYLRCMVLDSPWNWSCWLPLAEWWYNTNFHSSAQLTPFEIVYNQPPPVHMPYLPGETNVVVDRSLKKREEMIRILKLNLANAQNRMKQYADHHRSDRSFSIGDWVQLKLQPYRQIITKGPPSNEKLSSKFYGPFQVREVIGTVAYRFKLPAEAQIHPVFHVSQLKPFRGTLPMVAHIPPWFQGKVPNENPQPAAILDKQIVKHHNAAQVQYLVQQKGFSADEATWESTNHFTAQCPTFSSTRSLGATSCSS